MSVTGLLKPPRMVALEANHGHELVEDASDRIWSLLGQAVHTILERANRTAIAERRLSMEIEGWKISGGMDLYEENGVLTDYKVTTAWKLLGGSLEEWAEQLNCYAELLRHNGDQVSKLQVVAILRDWSKLESKRNSKYPQSQVVNVDIPMWDPEKALAFMKDRVLLHQQARISLPECSEQERWAKKDQWAVMQAGRKSAIKICNSEEEAAKFSCEQTHRFIVHRPGLSVRCESYCSVLNFCDQGQKLIHSVIELDQPKKESYVVPTAA